MEKHKYYYIEKEFHKDLPTGGTVTISVKYSICHHAEMEDAPREVRDIVNEGVFDINQKIDNVFAT